MTFVEQIASSQESVLVTMRGRDSSPVGSLLNAPILKELPHSPTTELLRNYHPEIVLYRPQIPPNTGTIVRLAAAVSCRIHIIEPTGFELSEKSLRRAGLDYWEHAEVFCHASWEAFLNWRNPSKRRLIFIETGGNKSPFDFQFLPGDMLIFGAETFGIPQHIMQSHLSAKESPQIHEVLTLPMYHEKVRSLNLSNTVSVVTYAALASVRKSVV
jgi:tRNA (cytidine/uridine-2'-O-)-methyltransferase